MRKEEPKEIREARRLAKKLTKENGKSHSQNLQEIAVALGYKTWKGYLCAYTQDL